MKSDSRYGFRLTHNFLRVHLNNSGCQSLKAQSPQQPILEHPDPVVQSGPAISRAALGGAIAASIGGSFGIALIIFLIARARGWCGIQRRLQPSNTVEAVQTSSSETPGPSGGELDGAEQIPKACVQLDAGRDGYRRS